MWLFLAFAFAQDASVALVEGDVSVERAGLTLTAVQGLDLYEGDLLVTGEDATLVVLLRNNHVVAVDSDLELAVQDLSHWAAPAATVSVEQQLAVLLQPAQRSGLQPQLERVERIAGWHARPSVAVAVSGAAEAEEVSNKSLQLESASEKERAFEEEVARPADDLPAPTVLPPSRPTPLLKGTTRLLGIQASARPVSPERRVKDWFADEEVLQVCLAETKAPFTLRLKVVAGTVMAVKGKVPQCVVDELRGRALKNDRRWLRVVVEP